MSDGCKSFSSVVLRASLTCAAAAVLVVGGVSAARGATLYADNFDDVALNTSINGRVPQTSSGAVWVAPSDSFRGNGAGGLSADTSITRSASINVGNGYLAAFPGVYEISAALTQPAGQPGTAQSWVGVGFASTQNTNDQFVGIGGAPWALYRANGNVNVYPGPGITITPTTVTATTGTAHVIRLVLDTSTPAWTLNAFVDATQVDLNGGNAGSTYTYTTNPVTARYASLATGVSGGTTTATVDNFLLTGPVPEPGTAGAAIVAGGLLLSARRRRASRIV